MAGTPLLNKKQREKMQEIFRLYLEDNNALMDKGMLKPYHLIVRDLKGLVSKHIIKRMLQEINPEAAEAMKTGKKHHYSMIT